VKVAALYEYRSTSGSWPVDVQYIPTAVHTCGFGHETLRRVVKSALAPSGGGTASAVQALSLVQRSTIWSPTATQTDVDAHDTS
jgi:hypothetical protein